MEANFLEYEDQFGGSTSPFQAAVNAGLIPVSELPAPAKVTPMTTPVTHDDILASPGPASGLASAVSLEGSLYSPSVTSDSNDPGLAEKNTSKGFTMSATWKWIIGIVLALLALWYFFGKSSAATATA